MRKISKSRADDDVVSSTNGSINNEDHTEGERQANPVERESDSADNPDGNEDESNSTLQESKTNKKGKNKKRKSTKDKSTADEDYEVDSGDDLEDSTKESKTSKKSKAKKKKSAKDKSTAEEEYEVEKIVDSKRIKGKLHYLIRWKGYSADSDTWEPENTVSCPDLINSYNDKIEDSRNDEGKTAKKNNKRNAKKDKRDSSRASKRPKTEWDGDKDDAEYEVERILEVRHKKNGKREFFIHWKGWASKFDSWEPESNLNCPDLIKKFMDKVSKAHSVDARNLRVAPVTTNRYTLQDPSSGRRLSKRRGQRQRVRYDDAE